MVFVVFVRFYLIDGLFLLLDNFGVYLDYMVDKYFICQFDNFWGNKMVILVMNCLSYIKVCDCILQFYVGVLVNDVFVEVYIEVMNKLQNVGQVNFQIINKILFIKDV